MIVPLKGTLSKGALKGIPIIVPYCSLHGSRKSAVSVKKDGFEVEL